MKKILLCMAITALLSSAANAQYAIRLQEGKACELLTQSQLKIYLGKLDKLVKLGQQDVDKYGKSGAYPATAINFHLAARNAYDTVQKMITWLNTGSNNLPDNTNYVEASGDHAVDAHRDRQSFLSAPLVDIEFHLPPERLCFLW